MKSPFAFIVTPSEGKRYSNTKSIGGIDLIISTSQEDHKFSNREVEVKELSLGYNGPIQEGDILLVHHNVFKYNNNMKEKQVSGRSFFKDNLFVVENEQFYYMYKNKDGWNAHDNFFFKPVDGEESYIYKPISNEPLVGEMMYPNKYLSSFGISKGDRVSFKPESKYEFNVEGEVLYRIFDHQITLAL